MSSAQKKISFPLYHYLQASHLYEFQWRHVPHDGSKTIVFDYKPFIDYVLCATKIPAKILSINFIIQ